MEILIFIICLLLILIIKCVDKVSLNLCERIRALKIGNSLYKDLTELNREINVKYSPAVLSYLMDNELELNKDVTATLLNLYAKKIIDIKKSENGYIITKGSAQVESWQEDERYVYEHFVNEDYQNKKFNFYEWRYYVKTEYQKYYFEDKHAKKVFEKVRNISKWFSILFSILLTYITLKECGIFQYDDKSLAVLAIMFWGFIMFFIYTFLILIIFETLYHISLNTTGTEPYLSERGTKEVLMWLKFKKFIEEYTLIEDKKIEETQIYEKYIPYAMALNINKEYKGLQLFSKEEISELKKSINV